MSGIASWLLSSLLLYRYPALFLIEYTGAIIIPWPVNILLLAVGAFASHGYFSFWTALAVAVAGNCAGDLTDYFLTRHYGEPVIRFFRLHRLRFYAQLQEELRADAAVTVFTTRFAGSLSSVTNFIAGLVQVPFRTFLIWDIVGNVIEPCAALAIGYAVGDYWSDFSNILDLFAAMVAVSVILFILVRIYRRMERRAAGRL
jgi:membrane-associated protein